MTAARQLWSSPDARVAWRSGPSLVASERNLVIARWHGTPTGPQLRALEAHAAEVTKEHPGGVALLNVMLAGGRPRVDEGARGELARLVGEERAGSLGVANVVLVSGFVGTAVRAFLNAVLLVAQPGSPMQTFDGIEGAAAWLAGQLSQAEPWRPEDVATAWGRVA